MVVNDIYHNFCFHITFSICHTYTVVIIINLVNKIYKVRKSGILTCIHSRRLELENFISTIHMDEL